MQRRQTAMDEGAIQGGGTDSRRGPKSEGVPGARREAAVPKWHGITAAHARRAADHVFRSPHRSSTGTAEMANALWRLEEDLSGLRANRLG